MLENFETSVQYVLNDEGGYAERENEPGGACNKGVSFALFSEVWFKDSYFRETWYNGRAAEEHPIIPYTDKGPHDYTDLHNLTDDAAKYIYKNYVFPLTGFDWMPAGLDYAMVNTSTMQGPTGAIKILQDALGLPSNGKLDDKVKQAVLEEKNPYKLLGGVLLHQCSVKMHDPRVGPWVDSKGEPQHGFGPGWSNRIIRIWDRCTKMIDTINT